MTDLEEITAREAGDLIAEVDRLRGRVRRAQGPPWFPLVFFGGLTIVSAGLIWARADAGQLPLWGGAGIIGMWLTGRHHERRGQVHGGTRRDRRTGLIATALFCLCLAAAVLAGNLGGARTSLEAVIVVVAIGYAVTGWRVRSPESVVAVLAVSGLALALGVAGMRPWSFELVFGIGLVLSGIGTRGVDRGRAS